MFPTGQKPRELTAVVVWSPPHCTDDKLFVCSLGPTCQVLSTALPSLPAGEQLSHSRMKMQKTVLS